MASVFGYHTGVFQFDSSHPDGASGWSMSACDPDLLLVGEWNGCTLCTPEGTRLRHWKNLLDGLRWMEAEARGLAKGERWAGCLNFDLGGVFEKLPRRAAEDVTVPLFVFGLCRGGTPHEGRASKSEMTAVDNFTRAEFEGAVARVVEYIRAGDVFQVNLAQRLARRVNAPPAAVYERLRARTPAWFGALMEFPEWLAGGFAVVSNSPELFLRVEGDGRVVTRPIKGTRARGEGMAEELLASKKDEAELNMIVDLDRNDLGRVCEIGSVKVTEARVIEAHPTVFHGVATIEGRLKAGVGLVELLRATFPPGSVTGAPKIRAVEIIDELEPNRRGVYCGAVGYLERGGVMQFNVAIRTMTIREGIAYVPVGGGIVADSIPGAEWEETMVKARAMLDALK